VTRCGVDKTDYDDERQRVPKLVNHAITGLQNWRARYDAEV
jgi:hypothetical protein